jgi:hypothetical protein
MANRAVAYHIRAGFRALATEVVHGARGTLSEIVRWTSGGITAADRQGQTNSHEHLFPG